MLTVVYILGDQSLVFISVCLVQLALFLPCCQVFTNSGVSDRSQWILPQLCWSRSTGNSAHQVREESEYIKMFNFIFSSLVPETKGRTEEEIQSYFSKSSSSASSDDSEMQTKFLDEKPIIRTQTFASVSSVTRFE